MNQSWICFHRYIVTSIIMLFWIEWKINKFRISFSGCLSPDSPEYGSVDDNGTVAIYTCNAGFSLNGIAQRTCKDDGTGWSNNSPICGMTHY